MFCRVGHKPACTTHSLCFTERRSTSLFCCLQGRPKYSASSSCAAGSGLIGANTTAAFGRTYAASTTIGVNDGHPTSSTSGALTTPPAVLRSLSNTSGGSSGDRNLDVGGSSAGSVYNKDHRPYQRPGLRRCTHLQDSLKYEVTRERPTGAQPRRAASRLQINQLQTRLSKNVLKTSKVIENYLQYYEQRRNFDGFLVALGSAADPFQSHSNPWTSDTVDLWASSCRTGDISTRRLKLWEESFEELLCDQLG